MNAMPLLNAFEQRLALAEKAVRVMKKKLDNQSEIDKCKECSLQSAKSQSLKVLANEQSI